MTTAIAERPAAVGLIEKMAARASMDPGKFAAAVRATVFDGKGTNEEFAAFMLVADRYGLDPITKEIYAFPKKGGGIQPVVSIDGWINLANSHPAFDGMEFQDIEDAKGHLTAIKCRIHRKDRSYPIEAIEYLSECKRPTDPWRQWPHRMLRHKSAIQAIRMAFGFAGIVDPDEAERWSDATGVVQQHTAPRVTQSAMTAKLLGKPAVEIVDAVESEAEPETIDAVTEPEDQPTTHTPSPDDDAAMLREVTLSDWADLFDQCRDIAAAEDQQGKLIATANKLGLLGELSDLANKAMKRNRGPRSNGKAEQKGLLPEGQGQHHD